MTLTSPAEEVFSVFIRGHVYLLLHCVFVPFHPRSSLSPFIGFLLSLFRTRWSPKVNKHITDTGRRCQISGPVRNPHRVLYSKLINSQPGRPFRLTNNNSS